MRIAANVKLWKRATSLGAVESLIEHRASIEGPGTPCPSDLLRLSVGLETTADLIADLGTALGAHMSVGGALCAISRPDGRQSAVGARPVGESLTKEFGVDALISAHAQIVDEEADAVVSSQAVSPPVAACEGSDC